MATKLDQLARIHELLDAYVAAHPERVASLAVELGVRLAGKQTRAERQAWLETLEANDDRE